MTKVDIISGFLGAGKTTFIKELVSRVYAGEKLVLIENEFGEIGIDGGFLKDAGIEITEMNSGCICCTLVGDFSEALQKVLDQYHPDRVIIEPSGVGKLSDIVKAIEDVKKDADIEIDGRITVVDGKKTKMYLKNFGEFFEDQVQNASTIVVSRTQLMDDAKLEETIGLLRSQNEKAAIISTPWDTLSTEAIKRALAHRTGQEDLFEEEEHDHHHEHDHECGCGHHHDEHEHEHEHHHDHDHECGCGHHHDEHDHEHEHHHDHDHECGCGHHHDEHDHEHEHHHDHDHECGCGHHHDEHDHEHEHHHDHDHECGCGHHHDEHDHEHEHHHDHDHECGCGHHHDEHDHEHEHHHDHEHECGCGHDHHHHDHDHECGCGHDHHHHHADEVFTSWGKETAHKYTEEELDFILKALSETTSYGTILRSKGIIAMTDGSWKQFDLVPEEYEVREGQPDYTGRICVIGTDVKEEELAKLFHV